MNSFLNLLRAEHGIIFFGSFPKISWSARQVTGMPGRSGRIVKNAWGMGHSVRTTQPGVLYSTEFVNLAAAAAEAVCQGEVRDG